jgi:K+-sensing histidine kinase KdpD
MAAGVIAAGSAVSVLLYRVFPHNPMMFYTMAVLIAAWFGGRGPGVFASLLATIAGPWLFDPKFPRAVVPGDVLRLLMFLFMTVVVGTLAGARKSAEDKLRASNEELERRIGERTAELQRAPTKNFAAKLENAS